VTSLAGLDLLRELDAWHAFDPVALPGQRTLLYVPFEQLVGGRHEARVLAALENSQRVALVAPIGAGKSSLIEYVAMSAADSIAAIWVSAGHEKREVLMDPPEFARLVIREIVDWARGIRLMSEDERRSFLLETGTTLPSRSQLRRQTLSLKLALGWLQPGMTDEVQETLADPDVDRNRADFVDSLDRLVELIHDDLGRTPVLIIDDSDRWLRLETGNRDALLDAFFGDTCRMLAERNWAVIMAVHPEYCAAPAFRGAMANGYFNAQFDVPQLPDARAIRHLFDVRIGLTVDAALQRTALEAAARPVATASDAAAVFEGDFEAILFESYTASDRNLRALLTVAQQALQEAIGRDEAIVSNAALREAALALAP
jgi:hypothetical protein